MRGGIYIHLPYCASRCGYCSFVVTTDPGSRESYLAALCEEIELAAAEAESQPFDTVYLGGGTPSQIPPEETAALLARLRRRFRIAGDAEVTLEANPEDVTPPVARAWKEAGLTRVSVGVQSLEDRELAAVGRRHDAAGALEALSTLFDRGFSLSADLLLGLPEQTASTFRRSLASLAATGIDHLSVYLLETEKSPPLEADRRANPSRYLGDDAQADLWLEIGESLESLGFRHYEISNWARPGRESRHNLKYWQRVPTLGLGVSAHEFWSGRRRANVSAIPAYLAGIGAGRRVVALDRLVDPREEARERVLLGLRLAGGVPRVEIEAEIASSGDPDLFRDYEAWTESGFLFREGDRVALTERGFLVSNEILCRFV